MKPPHMLATAYEKEGPLRPVWEWMKAEGVTWADGPVLVMFPADQLEEYMPLVKLISDWLPKPDYPLEIKGYDPIPD